MSKTPIYMDYAAATPVDPKVLAAMQPFFSDNFYNPSATYLAAKGVRSSLEEARGRIASSLGVRPREIIFTAGATEANNVVIHGVMQQFPGSNLVVSSIEHDSVLRAAQQHEHALASVDSNGQINIPELVKLINDATVLVSIIYANNEIGTVQHLGQIADALATIKAERLQKGNDRPLYFHTDAAQAANYLSIFPQQLKVDLMSVNGGKLYGPKQSGLLYVATGVRLAPQIHGGGQEFGLRSGTENVPGSIGLSYALQQAVAGRSANNKAMRDLQKLFLAELRQHVPTAQVTAQHGSTRLPNLVHITLPGFDNERLMMELDERGIQCAVGSACSASNDEPSHVLKAIGLSDSQAQSSLRFSMGRSTTAADITTVVKALKELIQ